MPRRHLARPPGRDQHAAVRPLAPAHRLPAAAGAADLPAGAVREGRPPLLRAPDPRASGQLGRAEAPLGPEALAARRRPDAAARWAGRGSTRASRSRSDSPDNLYETLPGDPGAHGRFDDQRARVDALDVAAPAALARRRHGGRRGRAPPSLGSWHALARLGHEPGRKPASLGRIRSHEWHCSRSKTCTSRSRTAPRSSRASTSPWTRTRSTRSWARTAPGSRRSPTR